MALKIPSAPLARYCVLDLTTFLSGPFTTQVLADLGATVVKVEAPDGDSSRSIPPHFIEDDSAYFLSTNRSKQSVVVDLKQTAGVELVKRLIAKADVVVENYRPGVAQRIGLDPQTLCAQHPRLIWAAISGFGQTGPSSGQPAYDMIVQALSGVMSLTGEVGRPAVRLGIPAGDIVAGLYAGIAINAALADRERTGEGRFIDIAMLDCQLAMLSYQSAYALNTGTVPQPQAARHDSIPTYRSFLAGDGREFVVTANTQRMWQGMCRAIGQGELIEDGRFNSAGQRLVHKEVLWEILETAMLARSAAQWVQALQAEGVPAALIKNVPEALADARSSQRSMILGLESASGQAIEVVGNPIKFPAERECPAQYPPKLGQDTGTVLRDWLGMDAQAQRALHAASVIQCPFESIE